MSQARLLTGASNRVLERSSTARLSSHHQRLHADFGFPVFYHSASSTGLQCRGRASTSTHRVAITFLLPPSLYVRAVSASAPQTSTSTKSNDPLPPTPTASTGSKAKPKVELQPGPAKPLNSANTKPASQSSSQPQASAAANPHPTKPPSLPDTPSKGDVLKETENDGVIELAKKDVADAARHGILTPPPPDANIAMRLFHQVKELFKFYIAGLKYVYANRKEARKIKARVESGGLPMSWKEHRFILTNNSDMVKLVPFVLTLLVIEEIIPLIVIYVPGMLPSTCILPSQRARIDAKRHERQREAYASAKSLEILNNSNFEGIQLKAFNDEEIKLLCSTVGISSFAHFGIHRRKLAKYLRSITEEDNYLLKEGKGAKLKQNEITGTLWDRGFLADSYTPAQQRDRLRWWLDNVKVGATSTDRSAADVRASLLLRILRESQL